MDKAIFREDDHSYWLGDKRIPISVTQLMKKHNLSPSYSGVSADVLSASAERGNLIHKEIEDYINNGDIGFTSEFSDFLKIVDELKLIEMQSEIIVNNEVLAGKADLMAKRIVGKKTLKVLADVKTTAVAHKQSVRWQLSLLEKLAGVDFDEFYLIHLGKNSKAIALERITKKEVERLLECERNGEIYQEPGLMVANDLIERAQTAELAFKEAEAQKNAAEKIAKEYRQALYEAMGAQNISSWETFDKSMLITRIEPSIKTTIDSAKLKKELPEIAEKYSKTSETKGYVRITLREG